MDEKLIKEINDECPDDQGIFSEPYGIPNSVKELVVYCRYETGGYSGGSCWEEDTERYSVEEPKDAMKVLEILLEKIAPKITYLQFRKIEAMVQDSDETKWEYYGNSTDYRIQYIVLAELEKFLNEINEDED